MEAVRRYVFPLIWMLIFGLIALALVRLAFFPANADDGMSSGDEVFPTLDYDQYALVPAMTSDIASELALPATVRPDDPTIVSASRSGEVVEIFKRNGDRVEEGERIIQVRQPDEQATARAQAQADAAAAGTPGGVAAPVKPKYFYYDIEAPKAGILQEMTLQETQQVTIGESIAKVSPGTYAIVADLTPEQQLQLLDRDIVASAMLPTTADPVACQSPSIDELSGEETDEQQPTTTTDPFTGMPVTSSTSAAKLRCPVPPEAKIVPGLSVDVTVNLGTATGVLTVPTTAVEGELADGTVYTLDESTGEPVPVPVKLGLRGDGIVEITEGLTEGQEILQFVPGVENTDMGMGGDVW